MSVLSEKVYAKILMIELVHSAELKSTVAIFEEDTHQLESHCFLLASNPIELATAARQFWETQTNPNCEPKVLYINHRFSFDDHLSQQKVLLMFGILGAPIEKQFRAQLLIRTKEISEEKIGTRVFQKLSYPPFYGPELKFFPAKAIFAS